MDETRYEMRWVKERWHLTCREHGSVADVPATIGGMVSAHALKLVNAARAHDEEAHHHG